ncbi:MAG TPA: DUF1648 domain-containing protein [Acidimicrobiia bacterium]|nr:DUF1648 domain-containing protein [Acidimicrobiia bacterium]
MSLPRRWGPLLLWSLLMLVISLIPLAIGWGRLPDPVATHWGFAGDADASMPRLAVPLLMVGLVGVGLLTTSLFRAGKEPTPEAFAMVGLMGGMGTALVGLVVYLNWEAASWAEAGTFNLWHVGLVLAGAFAGGATGFVLGRRWYPVRSVTAAGPMIEVAPGERVSWVGRASVRWPLLLLGGAALVFVGVPDIGAWLAGLFVILALAFMQVEANVDNDGLTIRLGGIPVRRIALDRVSSARAIDLEPAQWGGWGWRASPNGSAIVLRRGEALELTFTGGRRFAVTVDDAATGAALLNGLLARLLGET